jgi:hypothetical protein
MRSQLIEVRMNAVRIHTRIDSETLNLPELRPMIGKQVEIIVMEEPAQTMSEHNLAVLDEIAGKIDLHWDAIEKFRDVSMPRELKP